MIIVDGDATLITIERIYALGDILGITLEERPRDGLETWFYSDGHWNVLLQHSGGHWRLPLAIRTAMGEDSCLPLPMLIVVITF